MGADFLAKSYDGELSGAEVKRFVIDLIKASKRSLQADPEYDGYSGKWGEAEASCDVYEGKLFDSYRQAEDWLSEKAEKWGGAKAVRYRLEPSVDGDKREDFKKALREALQTDKKLLKYASMSEALNEKFQQLALAVADIKKGVGESFDGKKKAFHKCPGCQSQLADQYIKRQHNIEPVKLRLPLQEGPDYFAFLRTSTLPSCPLCSALFIEKGRSAALGKKIDALNEVAEKIAATEQLTRQAQEAIGQGLLKKFKAVEKTAWLCAALVSC